MLAIFLVCACEPASGDTVWIPSDTDDRCNVVAVGDKVALFWSDDAPRMPRGSRSCGAC